MSTILDENLETIGETKQKFQKYRELVKTRARELEDEKINVRRLNPKEEEKLENLRVIEQYLTRAIDEHQRILNGHFDLKALYTKELEQLSQMSLIRRFPLRSELYDKVLEKPECLERLDYFLRPLFGQNPDKIYNLNKALEFQRSVRQRTEEDEEELLDFDEEAWEQEQEKRIREKLKQYEGSLAGLLKMALERGEISLLQVQEKLEQEEWEEQKNHVIPNTEIFKEIMVELIKAGDIDIHTLKQERQEYIQEKSEGFQLNEMLLELSDRWTLEGHKGIRAVHVSRIEDGKTVIFHHVRNEDGCERSIRCSNVLIRVMEEE